MSKNKNKSHYNKYNDKDFIRYNAASTDFSYNETDDGDDIDADFLVPEAEKESFLSETDNTDTAGSDSDVTDIKEGKKLPENSFNESVIQHEESENEADSQCKSKNTAAKDKSSGKGAYRHFFRVLFVVFCIGILLISAGAAVFAVYMRAYENSRPEHLIGEYTDNISAESLADILTADYADFGENEFETRASIISALKSTILSEKLIFYRDVENNTAEHPFYTIATGERELLRVGFSETGSDFFGFAEYGAAEVSLIADFSDLKNDSLIIKAPSDGNVAINGKAVTDDYLESIEPYSIGLSFEAAEQLKSVKVYNIKGFYCTPDITVSDSDGNSFTVYSSDGREIVYDYPESSRHEYTITAPYGYDVSLNNYRLDESYIVENNIPFDYTNEYNKNAENVPVRVKYVVSSLITYPKVSVTDKNGTVFEPEQSDALNFSYGFPESELVSVDIIAPDDATVSVNGITLGNDEITESGLPYNNISGVDIKYYSAPYGTKNLYRIENLYSLPEITVTDTDGNRLLPLVNGDKYDYTATEMDSERAAQFEKIVKEFIDGYIIYYTGGRNAIYTNFSKYVRPYVLDESEAYDELNTVLGTLRWSYETSVAEKEINIYNFSSWSDRCFSCYVDFKLEMNTFYDFQTDVSGWELFFVQSGNDWLITKMIYH